MTKRYTVAVDFDGVIHDHDGNFKAKHIIEGGPIDGAVEWLWRILQDFDVVIFSCRASTWRARRAIRAWIKMHAGNLYYESPGYRGLEDISITNKKPPALIYLDDRAVRFTGSNFPERQDVHNLRPWNRPR